MDKLKKTILSFLKSHGLFKQLEKCKYSLRETEELAFDGWNSTVKYLNIICMDVNDYEKLERAKINLKKILYNKLDLGFNGKENENGGNAEYKLEINIELKIENNNKLKLEVYSKKTEEDILKNLKEAKYFIWITTAWITNQKIISLLNKKANEGLNIQVIRSDDLFINNDFFLNKNVQLFKYPLKCEDRNVMNNKFCVIDGKKVITSSYNWKKKAKYNLEKINIITNTTLEANDEIINYMDKFINLKKT